ncbi:MAG TPA: tRNA (guanosine(37)-N1)-methyltransferase TrmD [Thermoleophilia bacterium]|nr:tRNA (guanosine(37)-N1)-methyltransferase TrmD [Thermoleophilia bacterium]
MKRIDILTLVPEAFGWFLHQHPIADALSRGCVDVRIHNIRDYTPLNHRQVDDTPYGGGPGMVIRVDVMAAALTGVFGVEAHRVQEERDVVLLAPAGEPFDDPTAAALARDCRDLVLLCGRYEGFDARVGELFASAEVSVGPYVLAGGEVAAFAVVEAVVRKIPGVLGNEESLAEESFSEGLGGAGEYPQYTRPRQFMGSEVPEILVGGNHAAIDRWRRERARPSRWPAWTERQRTPRTAAEVEFGRAME